MSLLEKPMASSSARQLDSWSGLESKRALPVHFVLYPSKRKSQALCPCLVLQYININIIRILDPEHQQPYISIDSIFLLAKKSIPLALLELNLSREAGDYDLTLAGLEPREALWAPLHVARKIAEDLDLLQSLSLLLDWDNRHIWSLDEGEEGLVHNWRASQLDVASYSTGTLVKEEITKVTLQPRGKMFKTLISDTQRREASERSATIASIQPFTATDSLKRFEEKMLRCTVLSHETLIRSQRSFQSGITEDDEDDEGANVSINTADQLILLRDLLQALSIDIKFAPVSLTVDEIHSGDKYHPSRSISLQDRYRDARVAITLLHYYWTLYLRIVNDHSTGQMKLKPQDLGAAAPAPSRNDLQDDQEQHTMKGALRRLEDSSRRTEWAIAELLKTPPRATNLKDSGADVMRLPLIGTIDVKMSIILIVGILLGSAATSRM